MAKKTWAERQAERAARRRPLQQAYHQNEMARIESERQRNIKLEAERKDDAQREADKKARAERRKGAKAKQHKASKGARQVARSIGK